ncbi:glycoside hydrolase family 3 N-terminal domain-containing protein [Angustibacter peucedani]
MADVRELALRVLLASFGGPELPAWAAGLLDDGLGGICLYGSNVLELEQIAALNAAVHAARPAAITSLDEEGGDVTRLHYRTGSPHAGHAVLGRADDLELTRAVARDVGRQLIAHGVDLDLGPVADVNTTPDNPVIGVRSFGAEPQQVARHVDAWVRGVQEAGAGACLKHFPGHGDTTVDSHLALPTVNPPLEVLRERELVPFVAGVRAAAVAVMTSHVVVRALDPARPATLSRAATRLLREDVGFEGLLVSDALDMRGASEGRGIPAAAVLALDAGVDLLCLGSQFTEQGVLDVVDAVERAVADGSLALDRLAEAADRVDRTGAQLSRLREAASTAGSGGLGDAASDAAASATAAARALDLIAGSGSLPVPGGAQVLRLVTASNEAVGRAPWGLPPDGRVLAGRRAVDVHDGDRPWDDLDDAPLVVLARDVHRHAWVRDAVRQLRARRPDAVVVDLGWPGPSDGSDSSDGSEGSDVVTVRTWGASAVSGRALDDLLAGEGDPR